LHKNDWKIFIIINNLNCISAFLSLSVVGVIVWHRSITSVASVVGVSNIVLLSLRLCLLTILLVALILMASVLRLRRLVKISSTWLLVVILWFITP
jgi:hypothetical protein